MKLFHISDLLSVTTNRLVSHRHMEGVYDILGYLTGEKLLTHQLPRAATEAKPWLAAMFPRLMADSPDMQPHLKKLEAAMEGDPDAESRSKKIKHWVEGVRLGFELTERIPVYAMGEGMYTPMDPAEELGAMVGDEKIIVMQVGTADD